MPTEEKIVTSRNLSGLPGNAVEVASRWVAVDRPERNYILSSDEYRSRSDYVGHPLQPGIGSYAVYNGLVTRLTWSE